MTSDFDDVSDFSPPDFDTMTPAQFEHYLPELFASRTATVSTDPRLQSFLQRNPDCAALVRDLEAIAEAAMGFFPVQEPSDSVWENLQKKINNFEAGPDLVPEVD